MNKKEKEFELWKTWKEKKDPQAKKELISSLTPLIRSQVNKFKTSGLPYDSIELEGRRLTSKAIDDYDPEMGTQLNTYVTTHLRKLNRFTNQYINVGSIPEPRAQMIGKYHTIYSNLEEDKGREPTLAELSDAMNVSQAEISRLQSEMRKDLSMVLPSGDEDSGGFFQYIMPELENPKDKRALDFVYFDSDNTNKKIIEYLFGYGGAQQEKSLSKIKNKLKLSDSEFRRRRKQIAEEIKELRNI